MTLKYKKLFSVSTLALLLTLTPVVATAQGNRTNDTVDDETLQTTTIAEEDTLSESDARKARLDERKAAFKTRIDTAKQARIKNRCKSSQGKLSSIGGRIKGFETSRTQVHANLVDRLTKLNDRLKNANVETGSLETEITQLNVLIESFKSNLRTYELSVSDLAAMDCSADPVSFQASLEAARNNRTTAAESAKAVRTYLTETIKPTIKELKAQFAQNKESDQQSGTDTNDNQADGEGEQ